MMIEVNGELQKKTEGKRIKLHGSSRPQKGLEGLQKGLDDEGKYSR